MTLIFAIALAIRGTGPSAALGFWLAAVTNSAPNC
jgi:hypothetical protein